MTCGEKIAELRKKNDMTQDDLGKTMNVSYQAVSKWERGESQPDFVTMSKIAKLFGVPISYFEEGSELNEEAKPAPEQKQELTEEMQPAEQTEEQAEETQTIEETDAVIGVCTVCGKMLKKSEAASTSPKIICKSCSERQKLKAKQEAEKKRQELLRIRQEQAREVIGHGFDATLVISLVLTLAAYILFTVLAFRYRNTENAYYYGASVFFVPVIIFATTHALSNSIKEWRDLDDDIYYTRNLSLIIGACLAAANIVLYLILYFTCDLNDSYQFLILLAAGTVLSFTFVSQFLWGGVVKNIFTAGGFTFKLPGFIFSLSIDSILWMIVVKILLSIVAAIVFIVTTALVALFAIVGSVFLFVPCLIMKSNKDREARKGLQI